VSDLREQLQQARAQYASARYPGDLADDVLRPWLGRRVVLWGTLAAAGVAAAAVWLFSLLPAPLRSGPGPLPPDEPGQAVRWTLSLPAMPATPSAPSLAVPRGTLALPPMPSFPSWSNVIEPDSSTTQEAV
jgi:hypothetical protein